jgi:tetratricopeptide (TPR) repeat protein
MKNRDEEEKTANIGLPATSKKQDEATRRDFLRAVKAALRDSNPKEAFRILQQASLHYPDDPMVLSYYGCLQAVVDKKFRSGVENCKKAIALMKLKKSFEEDVLFPVFYLNLGRAYVAAGKKRDAIDAYLKGLEYDNGHYELRKELRSLGERGKPPVPFLDRSNPINKYVGLIVRKSEQGGRK